MTEEAETNRKYTEVPRNQNGTFAIGNPGRMPGTRNRTSKRVLETAKSHADAIFQVMLRNALNGDQRAAEYIMDRVWPNSRTLDIELSEQGIREVIADGVTAQELAAISRAVAAIKTVNDSERIEAELADLRRILKGE